eukprot:TRINITY_DN3803_c1_g1_i13.p1 TRINITY_DN3803_c1_g1~~TRINITY_DN3803_c1_g1_i13.p1  ORF type:complete len:401 (+),score=64.84 TRINITY_DN3803_c1_g1_i13:451-1653(+)
MHAALHCKPEGAHRDGSNATGARRRRDKDGFTPLHIASQHGHADTVAILLRRGAAVNQPNNNGATPLSAACFFGHEEVAVLLLERGADARHVVGNYGTPADIASSQGHRSLERRMRAAAAQQKSAEAKARPSASARYSTCASFAAGASSTASSAAGARPSASARYSTCASSAAGASSTASSSYTGSYPAASSSGASGNCTGVGASQLNASNTPKVWKEDLWDPQEAAMTGIRGGITAAKIGTDVALNVVQLGGVPFAMLGATAIVPFVGPVFEIFSNVVETVNTIVTMIRDVKVNRQKCEQLALRCYNIVHDINRIPKEQKDNSSPSSMSVLRNCIEAARSLVASYTKKHWFVQFVTSQTAKGAFEGVNNSLTQCVGDVMLSFSVDTKLSIEKMMAQKHG